MRLAALLLIGIAVTSVSAQNGRYVLGPPEAVAVGVKQFFWDSKGTAVGFEAEDGDGRYLNIYNLKDGKVKQAHRLAPKEEIQVMVWAGGRSLLLVGTKTEQEDGTLLLKVFALDGDNKKNKDLWDYSYPAKSKLQLSIDASPKLDHALVYVTEPERDHIYVIKQGLADMEETADLRKAAKDKLRASWSIDGTAYLVAGSFPGQFLMDIPILSNLANSGGDTKTTGNGEFTITLDATPITTAAAPAGVELSLNKLLFRAGPPPPPMGAAVNEVMPANGMIRTVRSRGPWKSSEMGFLPLGLDLQAARVTSGNSQGRSSALWLIAEDGSRGPDLLITPDVAMFNLAPRRDSIGFTMSGALFVRSISWKVN